MAAELLVLVLWEGGTAEEVVEVEAWEERESVDENEEEEDAVGGGCTAGASVRRYMTVPPPRRKRLRHELHHIHTLLLALSVPLFHFSAGM